MATAALALTPEQRREPRVAAGFPAEVLAYRYHRNVTVVDLSRGGAMIQIDNPPARGDEVLFKKGFVEVVATVAWRKSDSCGLSFHRPIELEWLLKKGRSLRKVA